MKRRLTFESLAPHLATPVLICFFLIVMLQAIQREPAYLAANWPVLQLWPEPAAQTARQLDAGLYDALVAADAALPPAATVLLATPGRDPRGAEYRAFHRALYELAPRPVWWTNPAPPDGPWESRWWTPAPPDAITLSGLAAERGAHWILLYQSETPAAFGEERVLTPNARLVAVGQGSWPPVEAGTRSRVALVFPAGVLAGLSVILASGFLMTVAIERLGLALGRVERVALAWALGTGAITLLMYWLDLLGMGLSDQVLATTVAVGAGIVGFAAGRLRRRLASPASKLRLFSPSATSWAAALRTLWAKVFLVDAVLVAAIGCEMVYVAILAVGRPLSVWDSWVTWGMKARIIALDGRISEGVFADPSRAVTHLSYPLLAPLVDAWLYHWAAPAGSSAVPDDRVAGVAAVGFFAALLGGAYGLSRRFGAGRTRALLVAAALGLLGPVAGLAALVFADVPAAVFALLAGGYLAVWLQDRSRGTLLIAALGAACLVWTKRDGLLILTALAAALLIQSRDRRQLTVGIGAPAAAALLLAGPWWLGVALRSEAQIDFLPVTLETLTAHLDRLFVIVRLMLSRLLTPEWAFIWPVAFGLGLLGPRWLRRPAGFLWLAPFVYLTLVASTFIFSAFVPYQQHVLSAVDRLDAQVIAWPLLWIVAWSVSPRSSRLV